MNALGARGLIAALVLGLGLPAATGPGRVDHGEARAELDPAAAQRIVAIAGDGDQGLIALAACQGYVKEITLIK